MKGMQKKCEKLEKNKKKLEQEVVNLRSHIEMNMFVSHPYVFFGEMSIQFFGPFFDWVVYFSGIELQKLLVYF